MDATAPRKSLPLYRGGFRLEEDGWLADCGACPFSANGLPRNPILSEHPEDPAWLIIGEGPGFNEVRLDKPFCLVPETPILMADLTWKSLGEVRIGDRIIAIDEYATSGTFGVSGHEARKWRIATVTAIHRRVAEILEVVTERGVLRGSGDHPVLTRGAGSPRWLELSKLQAREPRGGRASKIAFLGAPWAQRQDYAAAWLAGFFDGEGHILGSRPDRNRSANPKHRKDCKVGFSQNAGPTYERAVQMVLTLGYDVNAKEEQRSKGIVHNRVTIRGGVAETLRFLGEVRPERLIAHLPTALEGRSIRDLDAAEVISRRPIGKGELVDITTTSGTFIANGFVVHNCGASGEVVNKILRKIGRARDELYIGNATLCQPPQGSPETDRQRAAVCCKPRLLAELRQFPGKPILTLGAVAARALIPQPVLDAIDPPETPKALKKAQKLRSAPTAKAALSRRKAISKATTRELKKLIAYERKRIITVIKTRYKQRPAENYIDQELRRARAQLELKARENAIRSVDLKIKERAARAAIKAVQDAQNPKKPKKHKPVKISDIVGTLFDVDVDGTGPRPLIPGIHPAALLRGGGATIGGSHTPDLAFVNLIYDAGKVDSLAKGKDIRLKLNVLYEVADHERAFRLFLDVYRDALAEGACSIDLETYVDDPERHHALMAWTARIRVIGIATKNMSVSLGWELLPGAAMSMLQLLIAKTQLTTHNGLYDRTVLRAQGFIVPGDDWFDCYIDSETEFLTLRGWLKYADVRHDDLLATLAPTGALEWQRFYQRVSKPYQGEALIFETQRTRAVVTPNHRMWTRPVRRTSRSWRGTPMAPWGFIRADQMLSAATDSFEIFQSTSPSSNAEPMPHSEAYLQLLGLWLSDGHVTLYRGSPRSIIISQKRDGRASKLLRQLAESFPLVRTDRLRTEKWRKAPIVEERWELRDRQIAAEFLSYGQRSRERQLPQTVHDWPYHAKRVLLEAMFLGDGSEHGGRFGRFIYRTGSEPLGDAVQALALSIGWTATNPPTYRPDGISHVFVSRKVEPIAQIRARTSGPNSSVRKITVDDRIVCFSVPNETLVTRSRGKPAFYGNTLLAHHAAFSGCSHRLQVVTSQFYGVSPWKSEFRNAEETPEKLADYNARDTGATHALRAPLMIHLKRTETERVYALDKKMAEIASHMHLAGMPVDREINSELLATFGKNVVESRRAVEDTARDPKLRDQIWHHLALTQAAKKRKLDPDDFEERYQIRLGAMRLDPDWKWKIGAGKHIAALLQAMGVALYQTTATGEISTQKDVLEALVDVPVVRDILIYRENDKLHSTFVYPIFDRYDAAGCIEQYGFADHESRIHSIWNVHRISGRWASQWPVVSNVPKDKWKKLIGDALLALVGLETPASGKFTGADGSIYRVNKDNSISKMIRPNLRRQIKVRPGRMLVGFDFAQIEARVIALISGDPFLCAIFAEGRDPHIECSRFIWPNFDQLDADTRKQLRENVKNIEYGYFYMAQLEKLYETMLKAGNMIKKADLAKALWALGKAMPGITAWQQNAIRTAMTPPYIIRDFVLGRIRQWPMGQAEGPEAVNIGVQTAAASIMNTGMAEMWPRLRKYREAFPIAQIHDACVFECWADDVDPLKQDIKEAYTQEYERDGRRIPFPVDVKHGESWDLV